MGSIQTFEELDVWKGARQLASEVHSLAEREGLATDWALKNQLSRAAGSIMDNIAEGFERGGSREFIQFLYIAKGSAGEVRSQLYRCLDFGYITPIEFENFHLKAKTLSNKIGAFIRYLKTTGFRGEKYVHESEPRYGENLNLEP